VLIAFCRKFNLNPVIKELLKSVRFDKVLAEVWQQFSRVQFTLGHSVYRKKCAVDICQADYACQKYATK